MPLRLDIKKKLTARSDRVKSVDIHPEEPWILASLYNGHIFIWNYTTSAVVKSFEVTDLPVRAAKFVARKGWVISGSDDMMIRVYNYNTMDKVKTFEAHSDYIRCLVVHPTQPYVLSSSDDMLIKLWDWEKNWSLVQVFEGHSHYVMSLAFNPKDTNTFASASLDRTIKVWGLGSPNPHFTLEGHDKGVNCVEYFIGGEKPYLISGADDKLVKVWDYQNKTCVQTLEGHTHNVSVVCFHPELPIIISGSEDGTVRIWHSNTYRLEKTLNYGMERVWSVAYLKGTNLLGLGYDEGAVLLKLGKEEPVASMDSNGKIIWARHNEIQTVNLKAAAESTDIVDGERLQLATKELGNCEVFPQTLKHNPNGRFVVVCGDGEYIIYTALAWRNKSFGSALDFVWSAEAGEYAVRENPSKIKIFKNFKEVKQFKPSFSAEGIYGGQLLAAKSRDFVVLYDWEECRVIRRIDVVPKNIYWSDNGELVTIACESAFYILKYNKEAVAKFLASGVVSDDDGFEESFDILHEIPERVRTASWVGDCFIYTNNNNRLNYCVGAEVVTISHLDRQMYLLGYIPRDNRLYLIDKAYNIVSYSLHLNIINYQTAILRGDLDTAATILPTIPNDQRNRIAQFLDAQGQKELALTVSNDLDHKFDLAVQLGKLEIAVEIAKSSDSEQKWKQLSDLALNNAKFELAQECMLRADDFGGLLLLYSSLGDANGLAKLAKTATEQGKNNIAFVCLFLLRRVKECIDLLCETGRIPEAAFLARTYMPSYVSHVVQLWRQDLQQVNQRAAESLADPMEYENLFPDLQLAIQAEKQFYSTATRLRPASHYPEVADDLFRDLIDEIRSGGITEEEEEPVQIVQATPPAAQQKPVTPSAAQPASPKPQPAAAPVQPVQVPVSVPQQSPSGSPVVSPRAQPTPAPVSVPAPSGSPVSPRSPAASPVVAPKQTATPSKLNYVPDDDEDDDLAKEIEAQIQDELNN